MDWVAIASLLIGLVLGMTMLKSLGPFVLRFMLKVRFWFRHGRKGKVILFVYSDSSNWKDHIEAKILPRLQACSVVLNWSRRREWESSMQFESGLFNQWAGSGEFTPTAILIPLLGKVRVFRLWQLSGNPKHGKNKVSKEAEQSLLAAVTSLGNKSS
jgi:hypothetical protein